MNIRDEELQLGRTVGIEMEGYFMNRPYDSLRFPEGITKTTDGSLADYGVELKTKPITDLRVIDEIFKSMVDQGWTPGRTTAGTHVHVDLSDFNAYEKVKLLWFGYHIQNIMYAFVKDYRYRGTNEGWCRPLSDSYADILERISESDLRTLRAQSETRYASQILQRMNHEYPTRYLWMNVLQSRHNTCEFRLYHAVGHEDEIKVFALLSYHIVETVKHSSDEHLRFIVNLLHETQDPRELIEAFCKSIGLPFVMRAKGTKNTRRFKEWIAQRHSIPVESLKLRRKRVAS